MLTVIDTGTGNIQSVVNALTRIGATPVIASDASGVVRADALVLPGVGAFAPAMASLQERGIVDAVRRRVLGDGRPLLGICLGMQLLADHSDENGVHEGLGLVPGRVTPLDPGDSGGPVLAPDRSIVGMTRAAALGTLGRELGFAFIISIDEIEKSLVALRLGSSRR